MRTMYCNLTRSQAFVAFPMATRFSLQPRCMKHFHTSKPQSLPIGFSQKPSINPIHNNYTEISSGFGHKNRKIFNFITPTKFSVGFYHNSVEMSSIAKTRSVSNGFRLKTAVYCCRLTTTKGSFFSSYSQRVGEGSSVVKAGKPLPWLASKKAKEAKGLFKGTSKTSRSSWEESAKRSERDSNNSSWEETSKKFEKVTISKTGRSSWEESAKALSGRNGAVGVKENGNRMVDLVKNGQNIGYVGRGGNVEVEKASNNSSWEESTTKFEKVTIAKTGRSSWEESAKAFSGRNGTVGVEENRSRMVGLVKNRQNVGYLGRDGNVEEEEEVEEGEGGVVDDPRWDNIKNKFRGMVDVKAGHEKAEFRKWNKQEAWGRKTWKEVTESTVPKMVGEGVYGVGPVLAALSAGRREFYALYVQEGLDLSGNNRKKKDKRGFQKVLRIAEKIGLTIKEASKHDLNMVVDNRPHQGLVLDASPLEMVKVKDLDPISSDEEKGSLWVALDEVTDPQNLGAIIRSSYFFGASGVVLCAKNSAPLSGVVSKASAGSLELMELRYCKNMMQFLVSSAENGWRILGGSVSSKAVPLNEVLPGTPTILVLGSEGTGLRPLVERSCTHLVRIPGNIPVDVSVGGGDDMEATEVNSVCSGEEFWSFLAVESLNVSVAAGVLLHHLIGNNHNNDSKISDKQTALCE